MYARGGKRVFDRVGAAALLVVTAPLQLVVGLVVRATLGRPVLLRQPRIGLHGRTFILFKFRTMRPDRRDPGRRQYAGVDRRSGLPSLDDPRHTRIGVVLRRWSLDELPQLFNVLCGDMSLVGPRPEMVESVRRYLPWQLERHSVRPGITGVWQVDGRHTTPDLLDYAAEDVAYVRSLSFLTDLHLILRTPAALVRRPAPSPLLPT
ncbi:MAG: sugar transferase [Acidimicrobiia bacterium]